MKFFLVSSTGDIHFLARLLKAEGHDADLYIDAGYARNVGEGLVSRVRTLAPPSGATILFDTSGRGNLGKGYRPRHGVIGANPIDKDLEIDRTKATAIFKEHGLKVPETHSFKTIAQGRAFLATHPGHFFFKPSGPMSCADTYDGNSADSLSRWMKYAAKHLPPGTGFELQKAVKGTECSVEGWFDGKRFVPPFNCTFEVKRFLAGDRGPRTGGEANFVWACHEEKPAIAEPLLKLEPLLKREGFVGPVDLNNIWEDDGTARTLEASPRVGIPALQAFSLLVKGDFGEQLAKFAAGKLDHWDLDMDKMALALVVSVPPYPLETEDVKTRGAIAAKKKDLPLDPRILSKPKRYMLDDVMQGPDGPVLAGRDGKVLTLGVTGTNPTSMRTEILAFADGLDIPNKQFRPDPVERAETDWQVLHRMGLIASEDAPAKVGMKKKAAAA